MIRKNFLWVLCGVFGIATILLTSTLQLSSTLTPLLVNIPILINGIGSGGELLLASASAFCLVMGICLRSGRYYAIGIAYLLVCLLTYTYPPATAFQLTIAGLTIGGSLLSLGSYHLYQLSKYPS